MTKTYDVPPTSRFNVHVNELVTELVDEGFGASITSDQPICVERANSDAAGVVWASGTVTTATRVP